MPKTPVRGRFADPKMAKTPVRGRFTDLKMAKTPLRSRFADLKMAKTAVHGRFADLKMAKTPLRSRFADLKMAKTPVSRRFADLGMSSGYVGAPDGASGSMNSTPTTSGARWLKSRSVVSNVAPAALAHAAIQRSFFPIFRAPSGWRCE